MRKDSHTNAESLHSHNDPRHHIEHHHNVITAQPQINQRFETINGKKVSTAVEAHPTWLELLFDLVIIVAARKVVSTYHLDYSLEPSTAAINFILRLFAILNIWRGIDNYINRFGQCESLTDTILIFSQFCVIACTLSTLELYAGSGESGDHTRALAISTFSKGLVVSNLLNWAAYLNVFYYVVDARSMVLCMFLVSFISLGLWLNAAYGVESWGTKTICLNFAIAAVYDTLDPIVYAGFVRIFPFHYFNMKYVYIPLNVSHSIERGGLLTILAIGEVVVAIYSNTSEMDTFTDILLTVIMGFLYYVAVFHVFDVLGENAMVLALRSSGFRGLIYFLLRYITIGGIVLTHLYLVPESVQIGDDGHRRLVAEDDHSSVDDHSYTSSEYDNQTDQIVFTSAIAGVLLSSYFSGLCHEHSEIVNACQKIPQYVRTCVLICLCIALVCVSIFVIFDDHRVLIMYCALAISTFLLFEYMCQWYILDFDIMVKLTSLKDNSEVTTTIPLSNIEVDKDAFKILSRLQSCADNVLNTIRVLFERATIRQFMLDKVNVENMLNTIEIAVKEAQEKVEDFRSSSIPRGSSVVSRMSQSLLTENKASFYRERVLTRSSLNSKAEKVLSLCHDTQNSILQSLHDTHNKGDNPLHDPLVQHANIFSVPAPKQLFAVNKVSGNIKNTSEGSHKRATWLELLFDLVIITACRSNVNAFSADIDNYRYVYISPFFFCLRLSAVISIWQSVDSYMNRFGQHKSVIDVFYIFIQFLFISLSVAGVDKYTNASEDETQERRQAYIYFTFFIACSYFITLLMYIRVMYYSPISRGHCINMSTVLVTSCVFWIIATFAPHNNEDLRFAMFAFCTVFELFREIITSSLSAYIPYSVFNVEYIYIPINVKLMLERYGLLVIIAIGEVIVTVHGTSFNYANYELIVLVVFLGFQYKFLYFDVFDCIAEYCEKSAQQISKLKGICFMKLLHIIVGGIVVTHLYLIPTSADVTHRRRLNQMSMAAAPSYDDVIHVDDDYVAADDSRQLYRQLVFVCALLIVLFVTAFMHFHLHQQSKLMIKLQRVKPIFRQLFYAICGIGLILITALYKFESQRNLIICCECVLGICLFVEFLCQWFVLDERMLEDVTSGHVKTTSRLSQLIQENPRLLSRSSSVSNEVRESSIHTTLSTTVSNLDFTISRRSELRSIAHQANEETVSSLNSNNEDLTFSNFDESRMSFTDLMDQRIAVRNDVQVEMITDV